MIGTLSLALLDKQILKLRKQLEDEIDHNINNLTSAKAVAINHQIDQLVVSYIKLSLR